MVDVTPGDSGANKGFWKTQIRDKNGKFAKMGGAVTFDVELPGVAGKVRAAGIIKDVYDLETVIIEVSDNSRIPKGIYYVKTTDFEMLDAIATLPADYVAEKLGLETQQEAPLKSIMPGSEVLKERLRSVARALKKDGRFPIPRMTTTSTIGKTSDTAKGAKLDYKKVFDAEPALQEKYKTFENMWEKVYDYGVDERTQSPNELANIPEDMKELNRAYAKHVLGLDPEGLITFYRNAINSKFTEEESAVGYVSIDRDMAYDYNAKFEQRNANGRYEIDVKPAEVFGMIGYSKVEDEYGVTIGREVTSIPGRVRRVGDLASPEIQAPWLVEAANKYRAAYGASPFRGFNMLSEFDFHPVDPLGQTSEEFFQKYNTSAAELKAKFDQLYGEGAYDRYKASENIVTFQRIRDLFVPLPNGQIGLDGAKLEDMGRLVRPEEMVNDLLDNTLKMLSVFQELTGQPFMTHKTRDYSPPVQGKEKVQESVEVSSEPQALGVTTWTSPPTDAQKKALEDYASGELADTGNTYLRTGDLPAPYARKEGEPESMASFKAQLREELEEQIQDLSSAFEGAALNQDVTVYRSLEDPSFNFEYNLEIKEGESLDLSRLEGTTYVDKGFMSTSKATKFAFDARNFPIRLTIKAKAGQKAIDLQGAVPFGALVREQEVIFPPGSKFNISKARYDGSHYYLDMEYLDGSETEKSEPEGPAKIVETPSVEEITAEPEKSFEQAESQTVSYPDLDHFDVPPLEPKTVDEILALSYYTGETKKYVDGHKAVNTYLRTGRHYDGVDSPEAQAYVLKQIDALQRLVNSQTIDKNIKTFRYQEEVPEGLKAGDVWSSDGFLSTSTATTMQGDQIVETEFARLPVQIEVNIPAGFRGGAVDTSLGRDEGEVLLPPGSKFVVQSIEEVDEKTKISLLLVEQDAQVEAESSTASDDKAKRIAMELEEDPSVRFLQKVGPQLGSNEGGTFRDSIVTGKEFYVKTPKSEEHRRNEMLASALYRLTNIGSAGVRFGSDANGVEKTYSEIIPGESLANTKLDAKTKKEIQEGFAIDAWLANWDAIGSANDNILIDSDGKPYRIDMGGALLFRAQGAPKGDAFGDEVTEIDTLRDPNKNPTSAAIFGDMTDSELAASASKLLDISPEEIDILVDATFEDDETATELKNKLKARREYILKRFNLLGDDKSEGSEPPSAPDYSSIDYEEADFSKIPLLDESTIEKRRALMYYTGDGEFIQDVGHHKVNTWLRKGEHYPSVKTLEEQKAILDYIDILQEVVNSSTIDKDMKVLRYQATVPEGLGEEGAIWTSDGFLSTSAATSNGRDVVTAFTNYSIKLEINIPKGSRGGAVDGSLEAEVLLPPGSRFLVQSVEKTGFSEKTIRLLLVGQDG